MPAINDYIEITGACANNLKNINIQIPKYKITALTGPSGAGKSSLAFDTIAAEGARRLEQINDGSFLVSALEGLRSKIVNLPPVIAFEKKSLRHSTHTVASYLELEKLIYNTIKLHGTRSCPRCSSALSSFKAEDILDQINSQLHSQLVGFGIMLSSSPESIKLVKEKGYSHIFLNDEIYDIDAVDSIADLLNKQKSFAALVDRLEIKEANTERIKDAVHETLKTQHAGILILNINKLKEQYHYKPENHCNSCAFKAATLLPFNLRLTSSSVANTFDNLQAFSKLNSEEIEELASISISDSLDFSTLLESDVNKLIPLFANLAKDEKPYYPDFLKLFKDMQVLGLAHLSLLDSLSELSHSEYQRLLMLTKLFQETSGYLYIIDESFRALHETEKGPVFSLLKNLSEQGNTILLVEHDREVLSQADHLIVLGPGAGKDGGQVIYSGLPEFYTDKPPAANYQSPTNKNTSTYIKFKNITIKDSSFDLSIPLNQLSCLSGPSSSKNTALAFNILYAALKRALDNKAANTAPFSDSETIELQGPISNVLTSAIEEKVLSPYATVATYSKLFTHIRNFYANLELSKMRGFSPASFLLSTKKESLRCTACKGIGHRNGLICHECKGQKYQKIILEVRYKGLSIADLLNLSIAEAVAYIDIFPKCHAIIEALKAFNLQYLGLGQSLHTLSRGEVQRLKLSQYLNKTTNNALYILEEPCYGLSDSEVLSLIQVFYKIIEKENTIIAIENNSIFTACVQNLINRN